MSANPKINAIIVDDALQARKLLRLMLLALAPEIVVCDEAENVTDALKAIQQQRVDVVFLDIEMPGGSGLQLAQLLVDKRINCHIVFTTAYNSYAVDAFRLSAVDYLLKPIQENQLIEAVEKVKNKLTLEHSLVQLEALSENLNAVKHEVLCIPIQGGFEYLQLNQIHYLEADGSYVQIVAQGASKLVSKNLKYFESVLENRNVFVRVHRSFIVNMDEVSAYLKADGGSLELRSGKVIPVSRERKQSVLQYLKLS